MKECADRIVNLHMIAECLKKQSPSKLSRRKCKCPPPPPPLSPPPPSPLPNLIVTHANSRDLEVLYEPPVLEVADHGVSPKNHISLVASAVEEKPSVKDEGTSAHVENHEVSLNASLSQVPRDDLGTQCSAKQFQDAAAATETEQRASVATQNREPILLRVIRHHGKKYGEAPKLDKETCVRDGYAVTWWTRRADHREYVATYPPPRSHLSRNTYRKCLSVRESSYDEDPGVARIRERAEVNSRTDYHRAFSLSNEYYSKRRRRSVLPYDPPSSLESSANDRVSRIPLYARSRKHVRRRADLYGLLSRSYA